jgi:hypothetical protein
MYDPGNTRFLCLINWIQICTPSKRRWMPPRSMSKGISFSGAATSEVARYSIRSVSNNNRAVWLSWLSLNTSIGGSTNRMSGFFVILRTGSFFPFLRTMTPPLSPRGHFPPNTRDQVHSTRQHDLEIWPAFHEELPFRPAAHFSMACTNVQYLSSHATRRNLVSYLRRSRSSITTNSLAQNSDSMEPFLFRAF